MRLDVGWILKVVGVDGSVADGGGVDGGGIDGSVKSGKSMPINSCRFKGMQVHSQVSLSSHQGEP